MELKKDLRWEKYFTPLREKILVQKNIDIDLVEKAFYFAAHAHRDQKRKTGESYIIHPVAVAELLLEIGADTESIIAALLHDTVEDTEVTLVDIESLFGENIASLIDSITKATKLSVFGDKNEIKLQSLKKIFSGSILNTRAIIIKLADRVHNIQSISLFREEKQQRIAEETMDIYYPLAEIFGIWKYKRLLEKFSLPVLYPEKFLLYKKNIDIFYKKNKNFSAHLEKKISIILINITGIQIDISIGHKKFFEEKVIGGYDITVNINTKNIEDVYLVLGQIHQNFSFQRKFFNDYISIPKSNGYSSIHTSVYYFSEIIRFQIQTNSMFEKNEKGCFFLKPENFPKNEINLSLEALHKNYYSSDQYLIDLKKDVLEKKIFVFTDDGRTIYLSKNSIGVDFAYALKKKTGHCLYSVRVNGKKYSPTKTLYNEDIVSVITGEEENPQLNWIGLSKSSYTKQCIIDWGKKLSKKQQFTRGIISLQKLCSQKKYPLLKEEKIKKVKVQLLEVFPEKTYEVIIQKIGIGEISSYLFLQKYLDILERKKLESFCYNLFLKIKSIFFKMFYPFFTSHVQNRNSSVVLLKIRATNRKKMLYDILGVIAEKNINISELKIFSLRPSMDAYYKIVVEFFSEQDLESLLKSIEEISDIKDVDRE